MLWALLLGWCALAQASGPRFVTGQPYFTGQPGLAIGWKQPLLLYSTDPGDLSGYVNHAAADALVAAAAGVWNVPVASITIDQGTALAEHVSGQNVYMGANGLVFPADVMSSNAAQIPLAVIYDTDGSVTDTLLGAGASLPSGCRQNGVTESVDAFDPAGYILHAIIVINGRCTGSAAAAQLQLQYQLMRVFGRVLGLAWSQTNDNVFTGTPTPTPVEAQNWPIMHPLDIICGLYTYQCLPNPFTLRTDDIGGLVSIYPNYQWNPLPAGKQFSYASAAGLKGYVYFPTGEGMAGVNVLVRRQAPSTNTPEAFYVSSGVTGVYGLRGKSSSFVAPDTSALGSQGDSNPAQQGYFLVPWYPILGSVGWDDRVTTTEPINPLYTGEYSLGAYPAGNVVPSGPPLSQTLYITFADVDYVQFTATDAAVNCGTGADGTPAAPMQAPASGWWNGTTCGYGHVSYVNANVQPGRTFTIETTALDAQGIATQSKLMPVLGLFAPWDAPPWTVPSLGATVTAFNGLTIGTTTLHASTGTATSIRFGIGDQRGDGRPDFSYQARLFYADSVSPAQVPATGGNVTITGIGFRNGNAVTVNGVAASASSWSANAIVVNVPSAIAAGATAGTAVDVTVSDRGTGATSTMTAALTYGGKTQPKSMRVVSAPAGTLLLNDLAAVPFSVQLLAADGVTPVAGTAVRFSVAQGAATFAACSGATTCSLTTDSNGLASTQITPTAQNTIVLQAAAGALAQTVSFTGLMQASTMFVVATPESPLHVGVGSGRPFAVQDVDSNGLPLSSRPITFTVTAGSATLTPCFASICTVVSDGSGSARVYVVPGAAGQVTVQARDGDLSQTVTVNSLANTDTMVLTTTPPAQMYVDNGSVLALNLLHGDGTPDPFETITFTASPNVIFDVCPNLSCPVSTDYLGHAGVTVTSPIPGTYTVRMSYGSVSQTITFTSVPHQYYLKVLSVPANGSPTGVVAAQPFKVQVVGDDGVSPASINGRSVILGGATGAVSMTNCQYSACEIFVDGNSTATAWIIPQQAGDLTLSAVFAPLVTTVDFTAVGGARTMQIVSQPGSAGAPTNTDVQLVVKVIEPDGVTPMPGDTVHFSVLSGPFAFNLGVANKDYTTGGDGIAFVDGGATGYGPVVVEADDGLISRLISFIAGTPPYVLKLVSNPPSPSTVGTVTAAPFTVQVLAQDGVTPAPGQPITFTLTSGAATFNGCSASPCVVTTDTQGMASILVTPIAAGIIGLLAADGFATLPSSFVAVAPPDVLRVTSVPANGSYVGLAAANVFAVQALLADGVTPAPGRRVSLSVSAGTAMLAACNGASSCTLVADASGTVSSAVTPTAAGSITLEAIDGATSAAANFTAVVRPDTMRLVSAPSGNVGIGYPASTAFAVQVLQGDGVTPEAGKTVVFSAAAGSVRFGCGASTCSVTTGQDGTATTSVTTLAAGPVTLVAIEGTLTQTASFNGVALADVLRVTSAPAGGGYVETQAALPFTVQALLADGVTPATGRSMAVSVSAGAATLAACGGAVSCTLVTDASGMISSSVTPTSPGTITLQAVDGTTTATASFTAIAKPDTMRLVSAPSGTVGIGYPASVAFAVQVLQGDGVTAEAGKTVLFSVSTGSVRFSCGGSTCAVTTAADGTATTTVTPLAAGAITLVATEGTLVQTATFNSVAQPDVLRITTSPANGGYAGTQAAAGFTVQAFLADGLTPAVGKSITVSVTAGSATLTACGTATMCVLTSDSTGTVSTSVTPTAPGNITLQAVDGTTTATASFTAIARPDSLRLLSAPSGNVGIGYAASTAFAVQLLQGDGTTGDAGKTVVFSAGTGNVRFGCGGSTCAVTTAADGTATTTVTPLAAGAITLVATEGTLVQTTSFNAVAQPDVLRITNSPASGGYAGVQSALPFSVQVLFADGSTVAAGGSVQLSVTAGSATFAACASTASCTLVSDSSGMVSTLLTPTSVGAITLQAVDGQTTATTSFTTILRPDAMRLVSAPTGALGIGYAAATIFAVQVLQGDGVTAEPGKTVVFSAGGGGVRFGCGASTCSVTTGLDGIAMTTVTPLTAGTVTLVATEANLVQTATFNAVAQPDVLRVTSTPASGGYVGAQSVGAFTVQVLLADGVTVAAGRSVTLGVSAGSATFAACANAATCVLLSDASGTVSTSVTPNAAGNVTLQASDGQTVASASFSAIARRDTMRLVSAPSGAEGIGYAATVPLVVQVLQGDGVTGDAGKTIVFSASVGDVRLGACTAATCSVTTAADGTASTTVTPLTAGPVTLVATAGTLVQTISFNAVAQPDVLRLVSAPASGGFAGTPAAGVFAVQALLADGQTPAAGRAVNLNVASGAATFAACGGAFSCVLFTDASGNLATAVTPTSAGSITLVATDGPSSVSAKFTAVARPDTLTLVSAPGGSVYVGSIVSTAFVVRLIEGDGTTPRAGATVTFASGNASFGPCAASSCTLLTDANGIASTNVTPLAAGSVTVTATVGALTVSGSFLAVLNQDAVNAINPSIYLAEGATTEIILSANATQNRLAATGQAVLWSGTTALQPASASTLTGSNGQAAIAVAAGPLAAGAQAQATACAWTSDCATFTATGVSADQFQPTITAGAAQVGATLQPVTLAVNDAAGHAIAGASVTLYQTVTAYAAPCPTQGRCPAAPVLASLVTVAASGADGRYTFSPLTVGGVATQTEIAITAGTSGFVTTTLTRQP